MRALKKAALFFMSALAVPFAFGQSVYKLPPEWEPQESLWFARCPWTQDSLFSNLQCRVAKAVSPYETITLLVSHDSLRTIALKQFSQYGIDTTKVVIFVCT